MSHTIHCSHILIKTEKEANAVISRLKTGEKFSKIAKEVSLCPSKKRGGDLGSFSRGKMVREFEKVAFALNKGEISPVIKKVWIPHHKKT